MSERVSKLSRREALGAGLAAGVVAATWTPGAIGAEEQAMVRIGIVADAHKDVIPDANKRLQAFIDAAKARPLDFIIQMGDFCQPKPANRDFLAIWESYPGTRRHVLGNHDVDGGFAWEQTMAYYGMKRPYEAFTVGGCRFLILDGNEKETPRRPGYPRHIGREQLAWLKTELESLDRPTFVFSHQSLENPGGVSNGAEVRALLEEANTRSKGAGRVVACLSGHHHIDYRAEIQGITYLQINSLSYYWVGERYPRARYDEATEKAFPYARFTIPYRDPLFAFMTIDPVAGEMRIEGRESTYLAPDPKELGMPVPPEFDRPSPRISDRRIALRPPG
ncbi:MAG: metallophosphoesterase [Isosphaeraceae bacterium]|nr:metallophosphoesterase [Isosphaeraceae bacterium]